LQNLKGIEFSLDKIGNAFWKNEFNVDFPPSYCDTYEVHSSSFSTFIRFAGFRGSITEFRVGVLFNIYNCAFPVSDFHLYFRWRNLQTKK